MRGRHDPRREGGEVKKGQVARIVKYILSKIGYCRHDPPRGIGPFRDCKKCIGKWIRDGIKKSESAK